MAEVNDDLVTATGIAKELGISDTQGKEGHQGTWPGAFGQKGCVQLLLTRCREQGQR